MSDIQNLTISSEVDLSTIATAMEHRIEQQLEAEYTRIKEVAGQHTREFENAEEALCDTLQEHMPDYTRALIAMGYDVVVVPTRPCERHPRYSFYIEVTANHYLQESDRRTQGFVRTNGGISTWWDVSSDHLEEWGLLSEFVSLRRLFDRHKQSESALTKAYERYKNKREIARKAKNEFLANLVELHMPNVAQIMGTSKAKALEG
jgi:hypothetical protein